MTTQMIIALVIVIGMIVAIMSDKFAFGAPPLMACCLLVLTGVSTIEAAFQGFIDKNVIMIAGFMAVMAALQKTSLMTKIKETMAKMAGKGSFKAYFVLLIIVMIGAGLLSGSTGYYVMVITIVSTIPYNKKLPNSKLMLPLGFATGRALIPLSVAFFMGLASSLVEKTGAENIITMSRFGIMVFVMSIGYLIWALVAYKLLPDFDINEGSEVKTEEVAEEGSKLEPWKEYVVYAAFLLSVVGMIGGSSLPGEVAYIIPCVATGVLCLCGILSFKEARANLFSPLILMMASVIGVAAALADTGFTGMVGDAIAASLGNNVSPFILVLAFCFITSLCATLTGASIGSLFVFAPIAIATCVSLGINPSGCAAAMTLSAWGGAFLPIDGMPAMILGMGHYKLSQFLKYSIPMYIIQITFLAIGAMIAFPM